MTREEKLEVIYAEMANKELTLGCYYCSEVTRQQEVYDGSIGPNYIGEIIGHPVMIGTIFERYSSSKGFINSQFIIELVDKWTGYDRSIDDQSDECIDYVYSLIGNKNE